MYFSLKRLFELADKTFSQLKILLYADGVGIYTLNMFYFKAPKRLSYFWILIYMV